MSEADVAPRSRKDLNCTAAATSYQKEYIAELRRRSSRPASPL